MDNSSSDAAGGAPLVRNLIEPSAPKATAMRRSAPVPDLPQQEEQASPPGPVVILALDTRTYQARVLGTIDASRVDWVESTLNLLKVPAAPTTLRESFGLSRGGQPVLAARTGPKGRKVMVLRTDDDYVGILRHGIEFENAAIASRELGCDYNAVLKSFKLNDEGLSTSTVRDVTFVYADDYLAFINKDIRCD